MAANNRQGIAKPWVNFMIPSIWVKVKNPTRVVAYPAPITRNTGRITSISA